jgi:hypothetical protein
VPGAWLHLSMDPGIRRRFRTAMRRCPRRWRCCRFGGAGARRAAGRARQDPRCETARDRNGKQAEDGTSGERGHRPVGPPPVPREAGQCPLGVAQQAPHGHRHYPLLPGRNCASACRRSCQRWPSARLLNLTVLRARPPPGRASAESPLWADPRGRPGSGRLLHATASTPMAWLLAGIRDEPVRITLDALVTVPMVARP